MLFPAAIVQRDVTGLHVKQTVWRAPTALIQGLEQNHRSVLYQCSAASLDVTSRITVSAEG